MAGINTTETGQGLAPLRTDDEIRDSVFNAGWTQENGLVVLQTGAARGLLEALRNRYQMKIAELETRIAELEQKVQELSRPES